VTEKEKQLAVIYGNTKNKIINMKCDINKFSAAQLLSNTDGKTSASGTAGILCVLAGLVGFFFGIEEFFRVGKNDIMNQSIIVLSVGAGLLGYRKSHDGKLAIGMSQQQPDDDDDTVVTPPPTEEKIVSINEKAVVPQQTVQDTPMGGNAAEKG
jgi:hypothetical protein